MKCRRGRPCRRLAHPHGPGRRLYLRLQRVYRERAERDVSALEAHVAGLLARLGREPGSVGRETVRHYCKNARNLRCVRWVRAPRLGCSTSWAWRQH